VTATLPDHLELSDDVVHLRPWTLVDVPVLTVIWQDTELQRRFGVQPPVTDASTTGYVNGVTGAWHAGEQLSLAIEVDGAVVGGCDVDEVGQVPQLGYWLAVRARGNGYATRASTLLFDWVRDALDAPRSELEIEPDNVASIAVAERLGFSRVAGVERRDGPRRLGVWERSLNR